MSAVDLEELQGEIEDIRGAVDLVADDLSCAESCETVADYRANVLAAAEALEAQAKALRALARRAS